jgi:hypothetical protein
VFCVRNKSPIVYFFVAGVAGLILVWIAGSPILHHKELDECTAAIGAAFFLGDAIRAAF